MEDLLALSEPRGGVSRALVIGEWYIRIEGLDEPLATCLDRRWGGFATADAEGEPSIVARVVRGGEGGWARPERVAERYRIEVGFEEGCLLVFSYQFALCHEPTPGCWRLALADDGREPHERVVENAVRYLVARRAAETGGFALHAAGVLRDGRAHLFAGPSRAGKSTVVAMSGPHPSLGDDYALVLPRGEGWGAPAVPFDNLERASLEPPRGLFPVAGIWRLFRSPEDRLERPPRARAVSSLLGCAAFPWALPDLAEPLLEHARRFVTEGRFEHLHFRKSPEFWRLIESSGA